MTSGKDMDVLIPVGSGENQAVALFLETEQRTIGWEDGQGVRTV